MTMAQVMSGWIVLDVVIIVLCCFGRVGYLAWKKCVVSSDDTVAKQEEEEFLPKQKGDVEEAPDAVKEEGVDGRLGKDNDAGAVAGSETERRLSV